MLNIYWQLLQSLYSEIIKLLKQKIKKKITSRTILVSFYFEIETFRTLINTSKFNNKQTNSKLIQF